MELISSITTTWKLCLIGSIFGCFILLAFINETHQNVTFSASRNTVLELPPFDIAMVPMPATISVTEDLTEDSNYVTSNLIENQPVSVSVSVSVSNISLYEIENYLSNNTGVKMCNIFEGRWVYKVDENPSYDTIMCPFIEEKMSCRKNGRPDFDYEKWRWVANDCDIPLFDGTDMLERLRNKRVIIVGDSLNRNMWESLACLLYTSVSSSRAEVHADSSVYKVLKAKDYNTIVEFHWSPFLIDFDQKHTSGKKVLVLDKLSPNFKLWLGADVMVFNSGHWWAHTGKFKRWDLIQYKGQLFEDMPIELAYTRGMSTWAKWIEQNVDPNKTSVFFRSISAVHSGHQWCYNLTKPILDDSYKNYYPKSLIEIVENAIRGINRTRVKYLNITKLSEYRADAHPSVYRSSWKWKIYTTKYKRLLPSYTDCSHWCLPGLPDTWNRLLYASLFYDNTSSSS